jgi:predicted transcriptional regulator of viral defense system
MKKIKGYIKTKEFTATGLGSKDIKSLCDDNSIIKIKQGLYRQFDMFGQNQSFIDVSVAYPHVVIAGFSALAYHKLTTFLPTKVTVAIIRDSLVPKLSYPPTKVLFVSKPFFKQGLMKVADGSYSFKIYNAERAVCDAFKYRSQMGMDIAKESLIEYMKRKDKNINKLYEMSEKLKVKKTMEPWLMALV